MNQGMQQQVQLDFSQATDMLCDECGNNTFTTVMMLKAFSALLSPTGQETVVPVQVFSCTKCGHINSEFLPQ
jgi:hypothetical protein